MSLVEFGAYQKQKLCLVLNSPLMSEQTAL